MRFIDADEVRARLTYPVCIAAVRAAMIAFSQGRDAPAPALDHPAGRWPRLRGHAGRPGRRWPVRRQADQRLSRKPRQRGRPSHLGLVVLFEPGDRRAGLLRPTPARSPPSAPPPPAPWPPTPWPVPTPAAWRSSARAIRPPPTRAPSPVSARSPRSTIWGRSPDKAPRRWRARLAAELGTAGRGRRRRPRGRRRGRHHLHRHRLAEPRSCSPTGCVTALTSTPSAPASPARRRSTTTSSRAPASSPTIGQGVLAQGAEFLSAKAAGLIDDDHVVAEIGEVLAGAKPGPPHRPTRSPSTNRSATWSRIRPRRNCCTKRPDQQRDGYGGV